MLVFSNEKPELEQLLPAYDPMDSAVTANATEAVNTDIDTDKEAGGMGTGTGAADGPPQQHSRTFRHVSVPLAAVLCAAVAVCGCCLCVMLVRCDVRVKREKMPGAKKNVHAGCVSKVQGQTDVQRAHTQSKMAQANTKAQVQARTLALALAQAKVTAQQAAETHAKAPAPAQSPSVLRRRSLPGV